MIKKGVSPQGSIYIDQTYDPKTERNIGNLTILRTTSNEFIIKNFCSIPYGYSRVGFCSKCGQPKITRHPAYEQELKIPDVFADGGCLGIPDYWTCLCNV